MILNRANNGKSEASSSRLNQPLLRSIHGHECLLQAAGSTVGEEHRAGGSGRAERAMSMESAASASLPTTAIPKGIP